MKITEEKIIEILCNCMVVFVIPAYQRNYRWSRELVAQFYEDILYLVAREDEDHLISEFTIKRYENKSGGNDTVEVIDGQQRLTSLMIILKALVDYAKTHGKKYEKIIKRIENEILFDTSEGTLKLKLKKNDKPFFDAMMTEVGLIHLNSPIVKNYQYILERLQADEVEVLSFYNAIKRLVVIKCELEEKDDAQKRFDRINRTRAGFDKWESIRSYMMFGLNYAFQERIEEEYISVIEAIFGTDKKELLEFVKSYLIIEKQALVADENLAKIFEEVFDKSNVRVIENELAKLTKYARIYKKIIDMDDENDEVEKYLNKFGYLNLRALKPVLLKFMIEYNEKKISSEEVIEGFELLLSYIVRRAIKETNNSYGVTFIRLIKNIKEKSFIDSIKVFFLNSGEKSEILNDAEFGKAFMNNKVDRRGSSIIRYMLYELEERRGVLLAPCDDKLKAKYIVDGKEYDFKNRDNLYKIGNLTISGYIQPKGDIEGFIIEREKKLFSEAIEIWKYPDIESLNVKFEKITINDDWTSLKIIEVTFGNNKKIVRSKTEIYQFILECIYEKYKKEFLAIINLNLFNMKGFASYSQEDVNNEYFELGHSGVYVGTKLNNEQKKYILKKLIDHLCITENIYFKEYK